MPTNRLQRRLGVAQTPARVLKTVMLFALIGLIALGIFYFGRNPDLAHVKVTFLSGAEQGNYYATVQKLAAEAKRRRGRIDNVATAGSIANLEKLAAGKAACSVQFALVQDGLPWPADHTFELIGRLPRPESFVLVGRDADAIGKPQDLRGKRIGIGPVGSGTAHVARLIVAQLPGLEITMSTHPVGEQLAMVTRGELDLAAMVIDADAQLLASAVREGGLQIVDMPGAEVLAHRLSFARAGRIEAGRYDPIRPLPASDKRVIQVDTLVIGNRCARESETQGVITVLNAVFPDFLRVNRERPNLTGLPLSSAASSYYAEGEPDAVGEYMPWFIDIMPTARWLQLVFAVSMLFGAQAVLHRFRLWRIDAQRVSIEADIASMFGADATLADIATRVPLHGDAITVAQVDAVTADLTRLAHKCRRQSLSMMVPMGQEGAYRFQEMLIADLVDSLKAYRRRLEVRTD